MSVLETEAKQKHCWRINGKCLGAGCMSWKTSSLQFSDVAPWPDSIAKPKLLFLGADARSAGAEANRLCVEALSVLVGTRRDGREVVRVSPVDIGQKEVRFQLLDDRYGCCMEVAE